MDRAALKAKARQTLGGGIFQTPWLYALVFLLITNAILGISSFVSFLTLGPLTYAIAKAFLASARTGEQVRVDAVFDGFKEDFVGNFLLGFLMELFIMLWSLLFIIPGIVKSYAYAFAFHIKADHPDYDWKQCLSESERLTAGHKGELFLLDLSFIGWLFVCILTFGLGALWLSPYMQMTRTAYYLQLTGEAQTA